MTSNELIDQYLDDIIALRRQLHAHPELGFEEHRTQQVVMDTLQSWNIPCQAIAKTGVVALIEGRASQPVLAIRADIDGLPIQELNTIDYKSVVPNRMHACGHDAHTAILLGTARVLKEQAKELQGSVKLFFQPAEETTGGALPMIQEGCLHAPDVDAIIGLHVMPNIESGCIEVRKGQLNAASDEVHISVHGQSGHGAYPSLAKDAIYVSAQLISSLQGMVSRMTSPLDSVVLSIGQISGGERGNIICDKVTLTGTLRTLSEPLRKTSKETIIQICNGVAKTYNVGIDTHFKDGYESLVNDPIITDYLIHSAEKIVGKDNIIYKAHPSLGVEDFSFFSNRVPGAFFHLGCGNSRLGIKSPLHSNTFDIDESCIKIGIALEVESTKTILNALFKEQ